MAEGALIPTSPGRPSVIMTEAGVHVYVGVHDAAFRTEVRKLYQQMCKMHPDRKPRHGLWGFPETRSLLGQFLARERYWYSLVGLEPPDWQRWKSHCAAVRHAVNRKGDIAKKLDHIFASY